MTSNDGAAVRTTANSFEPRLQWETIMAGPETPLLSAVLRCQRNPAESEGWAQLLTHFSAQIRSITARVARQFGCTSRDDHLDLVQDVCLKISRTIRALPAAALQSEQSVTAYMKALTANTTRDILRARFRRKRDERATVPLDDQLDLLAAQLYWHTSERLTLLRQVDELLECTARDRAVFWLYYRQGLTAKEISSIPCFQLSTKGVESLIHRLTDSVRMRVGHKRAQQSATGADD